MTKKTDTNLELVIGKPKDGYYSTSKNKAETNGATFSRFVLPFAYCISKNDTSKGKDGLFYKINSQDNLSFIKRHKYFIQETATTLYDRALWLDMSDAWEETEWGKEQVKVKLKKNEFTLGMLPPRIVLFEASNKNNNTQLSYLNERMDEVELLKTGFLFVDIYFANKEEKPTLDDLLILNEFFRYFGMPYDDHAKIFKDRFSGIPTEYERQPHTENSRTQDDIINEKFRLYFERWIKLLKIPIREGKSFYQLLPEAWFENSYNLSYNKGKVCDGKNWQIYADNRTYVWTAALLEDGSNCLQEKDVKLNISKSGHWVKLLNVDQPPFNVNENAYQSALYTHQSITSFEENWVKERTYTRWEEEGSVYGYCYHAGAMIGKKEFFEFWSSYYFDTTLLLFYIRMTLFRFSKELTDIFSNNDPDNDKRKSLYDLRKEFSIFTVLYQFPIISHQQQSMEMLEINRKYFEVDNFFTEIQQEINSSHEFLETSLANELSESANKLAKYGIPIATGSLIAGVFGMNELPLINCLDIGCGSFGSFIFEIIIVFSVAFYLFVTIKGNKK